MRAASIVVGAFARDLVPFGTIETEQRQIMWPPSGDFVMNVFGFQETLATTDTVVLPDNVAMRIVYFVRGGRKLSLEVGLGWAINRNLPCTRDQTVKRTLLRQR